MHFRAFGANGAPATAVRAGGSGRCFTTSITVPDKHSYRCFGKNEILDPCFAAPTQAAPATVLCYVDPWSAARRLTLTAALPAASPLLHPRPWALELANGARCLSVTGTVQMEHGVPLTYSCAGGYAAALPKTAGTLLTAQYAKVPHGTLTRVTVTAIWTG